MKPLSLQADNNNRRMKEDKVQRALQQWIRARKISFILQIELAIVNIDFMFEKSAQIQSEMYTGLQLSQTHI
jgi:hypothetical protein